MRYHSDLTVEFVAVFVVAAVAGVVSDDRVGVVGDARLVVDDALGVFGVVDDVVGSDAVGFDVVAAEFVVVASNLALVHL